jgi:hypothetical protein
MSKLSRRTLVTAAAALPALSVPALAAAESASTAVPACTLPPDLVERFVRVRAWYLDYRKREELWRDEIDGRFYAATGFTSDQWRGADCVHPRWEELNAAHDKAYAETPDYEEDDDEGDRLHNERWKLAEAMMAHKPQTAVDLAWQAEAYLIADLEILSSSGSCTSDRLIRTLFHHIRTLGALLQPDDPLGALSIESDDGAEA